jgi:hypothetical protein
MIKATITSEKPILQEKRKMKPIVKESKVNVVTKAPVKKADPTRITENHLYAYMEKNGTKNKQIQEVILEKCVAKAGGKDNIRKVFSELFNYYKNKEVK